MFVFVVDLIESCTCHIDATLKMKVGHLDLSFIRFHAHPYLLSVKVFAARIITILCLEEFILEINGDIDIDIH